MRRRCWAGPRGGRDYGGGGRWACTGRAGSARRCWPPRWRATKTVRRTSPTACSGSRSASAATWSPRRSTCWRGSASAHPECARPRRGSRCCARRWLSAVPAGRRRRLVGAPRRPRSAPPGRAGACSTPRVTRPCWRGRRGPVALDVLAGRRGARAAGRLTGVPVRCAARRGRRGPGGDRPRGAGARAGRRGGRARRPLLGGTVVDELERGGGTFSITRTRTRSRRCRSRIADARRALAEAYRSLAVYPGGHERPARAQSRATGARLAGTLRRARPQRGCRRSPRAKLLTLERRRRSRFHDLQRDFLLLQPSDLALAARRPARRLPRTCCPKRRPGRQLPPRSPTSGST